MIVRVAAQAQNTVNYNQSETYLIRRKDINDKLIY